jgi:hypothetical protein
MGGSAILDPDILLDDLVELADDLRRDLHDDFGVRAFHVYAVSEVYESGRIGEGPSVVTETEFDPKPRVKPYAPAGLDSTLQPCGLDEAGFVDIEQLSLTYTATEITGHPVVNGVEEDLPAGTKWFIRIREAHGQEQSFRDFKISGPPFPDRVKTIGWKVRLIRIGDES